MTCLRYQGYLSTKQPSPLQCAQNHRSEYSAQSLRHLLHWHHLKARCIASRMLPKLPKACKSLPHWHHLRSPLFTRINIRKHRNASLIACRNHLSVLSPVAHPLFSSVASTEVMVASEYQLCQAWLKYCGKWYPRWRCGLKMCPSVMSLGQTQHSNLATSANLEKLGLSLLC